MTIGVSLASISSSSESSESISSLACNEGGLTLLLDEAHTHTHTHNECMVSTSNTVFYIT